LGARKAEPATRDLAAVMAARKAALAQAEEAGDGLYFN
jgi:hypothetical protein